MRRALVALGALGLVMTGVAMATPVPVLAVRDGDLQYLAVLGNGDELIYSYRQSIYDVTVSEHFVRDGERLRLRRVLSQDIRAIEYFRWETPITSEGSQFVAEPPPTVVPELLIRITRAGEQRLLARDGDWRLYLLEWFGENAVHVRVEHTPLLPAVLQGLHR